MTTPNRIDQFNFNAGRIVSGKYEIVKKLGEGWEGEVYLLKELDTKIERAAKFFYPQRNIKNKTVQSYAKKLHKLRHCHAIIKYLNKDSLRYQKQDITYLLSDYIEGTSLKLYLKQHHPRGMQTYQALHLLHAITSAVEDMHKQKEWHGDIHSENIMIQHVGFHYTIKLIDVFHTAHGERGTMQEDVDDLCRLLYDMVGGVKKYAQQAPIVKAICCGLKRTLIRKKFKHATALRLYLESEAWLDLE